MECTKILTLFFLSCSAMLPPLVVAISPNEPDPFPIREGSSVTFRCSVPPGTSISSISWAQSSGSPLTGITQTASGLLLTVTADSKASGVVYTCTVVDGTGSNTSQSIAVAVTGEACQQKSTLGGRGWTHTLGLSSTPPPPLPPSSSSTLY